MTEINNTYTLIMAGGVGSRFWPKSRNHFPKQFIDILGLGKSLLQLTYERFAHLCPKEQILILTNQAYANLVQEQLPGLPSSNILLEPSRNNTAPCIAYGSYKILQANPEANIIVAPSDHLILNEEAFLGKVAKALEFVASNEVLLTLGIQPTRADTGYGYIKYQKEHVMDELCIHKVTAFTEKPSFDKAKHYFLSKEYLWNAGIFIWSAQAIQQAFKKYTPEIDALFKQGNDSYNTLNEPKFIAKHYPLSPDISIDYAILEKADNVYTIPADIGWSDLGTWASLHAVLEKDEFKNSVSCSVSSLSQTSNCIIQAPFGKSVVVKGLDSYIVVDDGEVLLIYPKDDEQEIKQVSIKMGLNS